MLKTYHNYGEFRAAINKLFGENKFNQIIELASRHQPKFLSLAHIMMANAYVQRGVYNQAQPNKADFKESFVHIHLALKFSVQSIDLFLENSVKFSAKAANSFMVNNVNQHKVLFTHEDNQEVLARANELFEELSPTAENASVNSL